MQLFAVPVPFDKCPNFLIPYKPDWHAAEVLSPREADYYESPRALGQLYRAVSLKAPPQRSKEESADPRNDTITLVLRPKVLERIPNLDRVEQTEEGIPEIFHHYQEELSYISSTHVITNQPGARLAEEEIVTGTIVAKASILEPDHLQYLTAFAVHPEGVEERKDIPHATQHDCSRSGNSTSADSGVETF